MPQRVTSEARTMVNSEIQGYSGYSKVSEAHATENMNSACVWISVQYAFRNAMACAHPPAHGHTRCALVLKHAKGTSSTHQCGGDGGRGRKADCRML